MTTEQKLTPAQKQYMDLRNQYKDCILFFRMGDFYETFYEDAKTCAKLLDLTITTRDRTSKTPIPMAGIPYHAADKYIAKLVWFGLKVAIAEQMSEPKAWQIVDRAVTQVITPATFIEESKKEFLYIAAIAYAWLPIGNEHTPYQCVRGDVTVGTYRTHSFSTLADLIHHLAQIQPRELVIDIDFPESQAVREQMTNHLSQSSSHASGTLVSTYDIPADADGLLRHVFGVQTLASFWAALEQGRAHAMALLCNYLQRIQPHALQTIVRVQYDARDNHVMLDAVTIRNLELITSQYEWSKKYSLLWVIDHTSTALGARLLREVLLHPVQDATVIHTRQTHIESYMQHLSDARCAQEILRRMLDLPKIVSTLLYKKCAPTIFWKVRYALGLLYEENEFVAKALMQIGTSSQAIQAAKGYHDFLVALLKDEWLNDDIDYIRDGYSTDIDELRKIAYHSDGLLLDYQQELVTATGISNVKVKYVSNQWYVLEVTPKDTDAFEAASIKGDPKREMIRRQTLKTGQRYTSVYLDELQHKVLGAQFQLRSREQALIEDARTRLVEVVAALQQVAEWIAWLDIYTSHALRASEKKYVKPEIVTDGVLHIVWWRHPVIEEYLPHDQDFIPNDVAIWGWADDATWLLHIITGPNMWGKSTFLRQSALIVLLAQCWLYVPAVSARIPMIDGLFARVWSGDVIAKNQSTFMTEMIEMANILHNATARSFVILDELGRGTSTYDGMALAQAIVQYIVQHIGAKTLFATHYHELIALQNSLPGIQNFSVSVYETDTDVVFMKKIVRGWASKSYGLDVAKIAGIPSVIVDTAKKYLSIHESQTDLPATKSNWAAANLPLFDMHIDRDAITAKTELDRIKRVLDSIDPNNMTPMQALAMIGKLKGEM